MYKLIAIDMDGTLLTEDKKITTKKSKYCISIRF
ncbi:HAD hydrolase family protein [Propionispira arboris]